MSARAARGGICSQRTVKSLMIQESTRISIESRYREVADAVQDVERLRNVVRPQELVVPRRA